MKHALWRTMIILILLATSTVLAGSIYKWVDKEGKVHYSDRAPEEDQVEGDVETRPAVSGNPSPAASKEEESPPAVTAPPSRSTPDRKRVDVEIYTTSWCRYCRDAKRYFRSRGIAFKEYDVEKDPKAARRLKRYNPRGGVPLTVINGRPIMGYAPADFARALQAP